MVDWLPTYLVHSQPKVVHMPDSLPIRSVSLSLLSDAPLVQVGYKFGTRIAEQDTEAIAQVIPRQLLEHIRAVLTAINGVFPTLAKSRFAVPALIGICVANVPVESQTIHPKTPIYRGTPMPLRLNVGLSKKVGLPDYGSLEASCHVDGR